MRETIKELSQLDGAFIVSGDGVVISAARYINASSRRIELPLGLGSRHVAAASISRDTQAVAVVVSQSSIVRVFNEGKLIAEIIPEIWCGCGSISKLYCSCLQRRQIDCRNHPGNLVVRK
jgi:DNA integrity scanning protein DisA with diadenylate cyclase activity